MLAKVGDEVNVVRRCRAPGWFDEVIPVAADLLLQAEEAPE